MWLAGFSLCAVLLFCYRGSIRDFLNGFRYRNELSFEPKKYNFDGSLFIGEVKNGKPHGPGIMQLEGGMVLAGTWNEGKKQGLMRESATDGSSTFTLWEDDVCVGKAPLASFIREKGKKAFEGARFGIDVSRWQPEYWGAMAICVDDDGSLASSTDVARWIPVEFVIIKASGSRSNIDRQYHYHSEMADILLLPQGAYHVFSPGVDIEKQVEDYLGQIQDVNLAFPPILDIEGSTLDVSRSTFERWEPLCIEWLEAVERRTGVTPMIYCCLDFYNAYARGSRLGSYDFWIAGYQKRDFPAGCRMRQISETGRLAGWEAKVDIDVF